MLKLMAKHRGKDPQEIVEAQARQFLLEAQQDKFPIDIEGIASLLGIKRRLGEYAFAGRIYAETSGQLVMDLTTYDLPPRRRFTCGHEITHTLFPGFSREARYRVDATVGTHVRERSEEEFLCDCGAAELLLPRSMVLDGYPISVGLKVVERLAKDAEASLEAAANRLVELASEKVGLIVLEVGHKPADSASLRKGEPIPKKLRVRYAKCHGLDVYIPRFKSVGDKGPFAQALEEGELINGVGFIPGTDSTEYLIEAKRYNRTAPNGTIERVVALVRPTQTKN